MTWLREQLNIFCTVRHGLCTYWLCQDGQCHNTQTAVWKCQNGQCHNTQTFDLLKMSRRSVSQNKNCLLPEDVKRDSVTIHKLLPGNVKTDSVTIHKLLPGNIKTDSVRIHKLLPGNIKTDGSQCTNSQTVKRSFLPNHMSVHHSYILSPVTVACLKACHNSTAVANVLQSLWSIPRGHCSRDHLFIKPLLRLYCELFNGDIQLVPLVVVTTLRRIVGQTALLLNWQIVPLVEKGFYLRQNVQIPSGAHPASSIMPTGSFPVGKATGAWS
jgi:hypothetical protein